ncbi:MAG: PEP-CTERM sorting domain-containing protein [Methylobacter sp.]
MLTDNPYSTTGKFDLIVDKDLSNNGLWARLGDTPPPPPPPDPIPEPSLIWLMGIGLMGLAMALRKQSNLALQA